MDGMTSVGRPIYLCDISYGIGLNTLNASSQLTSGRGGAQIKDYAPHLRHRTHLSAEFHSPGVIMREMCIYAVHDTGSLCVR